jgi:hypothetical protein
MINGNESQSNVLEIKTKAKIIAQFKLSSAFGSTA